MGLKYLYFKKMSRCKSKVTGWCLNEQSRMPGVDDVSASTARQYYHGRSANHEHVDSTNGLPGCNCAAR